MVVVGWLQLTSMSAPSSSPSPTKASSVALRNDRHLENCFISIRWKRSESRSSCNRCQCCDLCACVCLSRCEAGDALLAVLARARLFVFFFLVLIRAKKNNINIHRIAPQRLDWRWQEHAGRRVGQGARLRGLLRKCDRELVLGRSV